MNGLGRDIASYLREVFWEAGRKLLTLLDVVFAIPVLCPECLRLLGLDQLTVSRIRWISAPVLVVLLLVANFAVYRRLARAASHVANISVEIAAQELTHPGGTGLRPFARMQPNPSGFDSSGLPDWGHLWAQVLIRNQGQESGQLIWEVDKAKTRLPGLLNRDSMTVNTDFPTRSAVGGRCSWTRNLWCDVLLAENDPIRFAEALRQAVRSRRRYRLVLRYKTRGVDGDSAWRTLHIKDNLRSFRDNVVSYWLDNGFDRLVALVHPD